MDEVEALFAAIHGKSHISTLLKKNAGIAVKYSMSKSLYYIYVGGKYDTDNYI